MKFFGLFFFAVILTACNVNKQILRDVNQLEDDFQHHSGFILYDPAEGKVLIEKNARHYFTPASNTKILTLYTTTSVLGDSLPGIFYEENGDSLIFWGTGDPSLLYEPLPESKVFDFLQKTDKDLYFSTSNFKDKHLGPGWSWDDYLYDFSSERSSLPIYGNTLTIRKQRDSSHLTLDITYFKRYFSLVDSLEKSRVTRDIGSNQIIYEPSFTNQSFKRVIPFQTDGVTISNLLSDTLNRPVAIIKKPLSPKPKVLYSIPTDSALQVMMQESDNFIAEQLLLACSGLLGDSLNIDVAIDWAQDSLLAEAPDKIIWVDGSGLSRYNLITPRSLVWLWYKLYKSLGQERLFNVIAAGGQKGTLMNYYKSDEPYLFGKTGTLSNNHNLSGFIITKKGKLLIFSLMNNNYPTESREVKLRMEKIFRSIYEIY